MRLHFFFGKWPSCTLRSLFTYLSVIINIWSDVVFSTAPVVVYGSLCICSFPLKFTSVVLVLFIFYLFITHDAQNFQTVKNKHGRVRLPLNSQKSSVMSL